MNTLNRIFSKQGRLLMAIVLVLAVALAYFFLVHLPLSDRLESKEQELSYIQSESELVRTRAESAARMREQLEGIDSQNASYMGSYNNNEAELAVLNVILSQTQDYSISFTDVKREGNQVRRRFALEFTAASYEIAEKVIKDIAEGHYRCLVDHVNVAGEEGSITEGRASVSLSATFFETMVGGTEDMAVRQTEG